MKIEDFLDMLLYGNEEGHEVMCAVAESEHYYLPYGTVETKKDGVLF